MSGEDNEVPYYYDVMKVPKPNDSSVGQLIHTIEATNNNQAGLNNNQDLRFSYAGDSKVIRLNQYRCGFRVKAAFRTKSNNTTNDRNANITLSSGWFWHLFSNYKLKIANLDNAENLSEPGIFADTMNCFKGNEFKNTYGELCGYIPDEGSGNADTIPNPGATCRISKADLTAITAAQDAAFSRDLGITMNIENWNNFNKGLVRRKAKYNYGIDDDATVRYVEEFFLLSQISGVFSTDTSIMMTNFVIELKRKGVNNFGNAFFGSGTTSVDFGNTIDTGLLSVSLELWEQKPNLNLEAQLASTFSVTDKTPKPIAFLKGSVIGPLQIGLNSSYTHTENSYHIPRYIICLYKGVANPENPAAAQNLANQSNQCNKNYSLNAHANMESVQVTINGQEFPNKLQDANFPENRYSGFYQSYLDTCFSFNVEPSHTMNEFRDLHFKAAFDCSNQNKKVSTATTNLQIKMKRKEPVPGNNNDRKNPRFLEGYVIVLEDSLLMLDAKRQVCQQFSEVV